MCIYLFKRHVWSRKPLRDVSEFLVEVLCSIPSEYFVQSSSACTQLMSCTASFRAFILIRNYCLSQFYVTNSLLVKKEVKPNVWGMYWKKTRILLVEPLGEGRAKHDSRRDLALEGKRSSSGDGICSKGNSNAAKGVVWYVEWVGERSRIKPERHP